MVQITWTQAMAGTTRGRCRTGPIALDPAAVLTTHGDLRGSQGLPHPTGRCGPSGRRPNADDSTAPARLALPPLPVETFVAALEHLVRIDVDWVPSGGEKCMYLRPFMFASSLPRRPPAAEVRFLVIASPVGSTSPADQTRLDLVVDELHPAAAGGTGRREVRR